MVTVEPHDGETLTPTLTVAVADTVMSDHGDVAEDAVA